ncbi:MAG: 2Fe-2S iron-sulfur cluster binding domain-containing protein [bacterium]
MTVTIILQKPDGTLIARFPGEDHKSLAQIAKDAGVNFPTSCGIGMCGICSCKIVSGHEYVQIDKISLPMKSLERDTAGNFTEFFACVGGITTEALKDSVNHTIVLEKNM